MAKLGHHENKIAIVERVYSILQGYFNRSFRSSEIEFKVVFEIVDNDYFKIINKLCNVGSPQVQHAYKNLICEIFKYILPKRNYARVDENNAFLKIHSLDPDIIMKEFKSLVYTHKKLKFKDVHTYYGSMNIEDFRNFLLDLVNVNETASTVELYNTEEFFEINP